MRTLISMRIREGAAAVGARVRAVTIVTLLVAIIAGVPALSAPADAETRSVRVATLERAPFVMTRDGMKTGFTIDLIDLIAKRTGWTVEYLDTGAGNATQLLQSLTDGRADAAAASISITAERRKSFDFSQPILDAGLQIAVPAGSASRSTPGLVDFLKLLFSKTMLAWLSVALILAVIPAHIAWLLERRHPEPMVSKSYIPGILQAFRWSLGMLSDPGGADAPRHWVTRSLALLWAFVSIIFVAYYTATLTANLTVEKFEAQINSPADLAGKKVCTLVDSTTAKYLKRTGVAFESAPTMDDCYRGLRDRKLDAVVFDAPVLRYYVSNDGAGVAQLVGSVFHQENYGIAFPLGSDLRKRVDEELLSIRETGDYELLKQKWFGEDDGE